MSIMKVWIRPPDMLVGREHLKQKKGHWFDLLVEREQGKIKKAHHERKMPRSRGILITRLLWHINSCF